MALPKSGPNSAAPTTGAVVAGVYNATAPVLVDGQACPVQPGVNGQVKTSGGGGGGGDVNLTGINGVAPALTNPLPVELSDGSQAVGTAGNPLSVNVITGGGSNASVGTNTATAPTSSTEIGIIDGSGNLQGASSTNPVPVTVISTLLNDPAEVAQGTTAPTKVMVVGGKSNDGTPQYREMPLGAGARSVIVEGIAGGTAQPVSGTVAVSALPALPAGANVIGHVITDSGSVVAATLSAETTKVIGTARILGNAGAIVDGVIAATAPANAVQAGNRGPAALPTAVTDGQLVAPMTDKYGRQAVVANTIRDLVGTASVNASAASGTSLIGTGGTGVFTDIISLIITNETSAATIASLTDGTVTYKFAIAANGGIVINFPTPLPATSSATAWTGGNSATVALDWVFVYAKNK